MTNGREMTPPPGFSTPPHIPNVNTNERPPVTTTVFAATTPGNTPFAYRASTSTDPTPMISPAFVEANYEILESLLRDRRRQIRNEDLRTELEYFSEDYDEEREMEPRPERTREVTPPLRTRSPRVRRQRERVVGFEEAPNKEGSRTGRNTEGNRPSEDGAEENGRREMNLPLLLAAHLGRNENGQPLQSSLTSVHGGRQSSINIGGNLPPNGLFADPTGSVTSFVCWIEDYPLPDGLKMPFHVGSYDGKGDPDNFLHLFEGAIHMQKWLMPVASSKRDSRRRTWQFTASNKEKAIASKLSPLDLPSTYKCLMEKTYTWIEAREVATNGAPNDRRDNFKRLRKSSWDSGRGQKKLKQALPLPGN
ncbi:hypothetical protein Tco_1093335 [Tanacetum coccineum]|uniref:Uncharacterized protein n=1 Tax=Tanacetum coccineum TaxID=301880 RepID=A0ABQ5ICD9_9ASTR